MTDTKPLTIEQRLERLEQYRPVFADFHGRIRVVEGKLEQQHVQYRLLRQELEDVLYRDEPTQEPHELITDPEELQAIDTGDLAPFEVYTDGEVWVPSAAVEAWRAFVRQAFREV